MLKKTSVDFGNTFGISNASGNFPNRPCILGMVPISLNVRESNGYLNLFMHLLQIKKYKMD